MDYIVNYNVNNVNIHCVIQEKDAIIARQQKEIEELHKANQLLAKDNNKLKTDLELQRKLTEALEKFRCSLQTHVEVLKDYDKNRWSVSEAESEVTVWEHEYLVWKKNIEKREREESNQAILAANQMTGANPAANQSAEQSNAQTHKQTHRRSAPKAKTVVISSDGTVCKRYVCDYPNCTYSSNWAHDLKGHKRKHTGEKPYCCGWLNCSKSFRDLRDLKRHQRAHTGDKRYSCDWPGCDYRSTDVANLAKHKRTHTGEKPYKCTWSGCEASFADGSHLRRHQKKHENQFSKSSSKSTTPKKRQTMAKISTAVKTRQQPSRRAKGSNRIPLEVRLDVGDGRTQTQDTNNNIEKERNDCIDGPTNGQSSPSEQSFPNQLSADLSSKPSVENALDSTATPEPTDNISSTAEHNQMVSNPSDRESQTNKSVVTSIQMTNSDRSDSNALKLGLVADHQIVAYKSAVVMSPTIAAVISDHNPSPVRENGDKHLDIQRL